jgi:acetone carboxylase, gamma subunit
VRVYISDLLCIDLDIEKYQCRACNAVLGDARAPYKHGLLARARDPREVHAPILDPDRYEFTFAPDPAWCQIVEYCCPQCGRLAEVEYLPPGHPLADDIIFDIDALKAQWKDRPLYDGPVLGPDFVPPPHAHHGHSHPAGEGAKK